MNSFTDSVRALESRIGSHQRLIKQTEEAIIAQKERQAATAAVEKPIAEFNEALHKFKQAWERLESIAVEHDIEIEKQVLPNSAVLYQQKGTPGYSNYTPWLSISFD